MPLLLGIAGWQLMAAAEGTELSHSVGSSLIRIATTLFVLLALRAISLPAGLAVAHFRWPESGVRRLAYELSWLTWVFVPASLVGRMALDLNPVASGGLVTRLAYRAAAERRQAALAARKETETEAGDQEAAATQHDYTEVDLDAVTGDTR